MLIEVFGGKKVFLRLRCEYSGGPFLNKKKCRKFLQKKGVHVKKLAFSAKNGSLTHFSYNSLISYKILDMKDFAFKKNRKFECTNKISK